MNLRKSFYVFLTLILALSMALTGCASNVPATPTDTPAPAASAAPADPSSAPASDLVDGTYEGVGAGYGGDIKVSLAVKDGKISEVTIVEHKETEGISNPAREQLPQIIVEKQSAEVDTIAGCTLTSKGILAAVNAALNAAKGIEEKVAVATMTDPDVLVVGGGMAGMTAAIEAATKGAKVLLIEKTGALGGTFGGGTLSGTGTKMQIESGITDDTPDKFFDDFVRLNNGYQEREGNTDYYWNQDLGRYYAEYSGAAVDWLVEELGATVKDRQPSQPTLYEPLNTPRVWSGDRMSYDAVIKAELQKHIDSGKVEVLISTTVDELILDGTAVVGVKTTNTDGVKADYKAASTILCTGGYGHAEDIVRKYNLQNFTTTAPAFATGDGFRMAEQAGGVLKNMDFLTVYAGGLKEDDSLIKKDSIRVKDFPYIIFVNKDGNRFVDELGKEDGSSYDEITSWWKKGDNKIWIMLDQAMIDDLKTQEKPVITGDKDWSKFEAMLANGKVLFSGSTIEEVATKAGLNGENLKATIERYNTFAKNGKDEDFGRTRLMKEFTGGTYYIFETTPYIMITAGGPDMNDKGQVVNANYEPIPGLYQAGEIVGMGNAFGRTTIGGVGNTGCLVWGKLAGGSAAEYALSK